MAEDVTLTVRPLPRALHRENLILGAEREPVIASLTLTAALAVPSLDSPVMLAVLAGIQILVVVGLRRLAKYDPRFLEVYRRHTSYHDAYLGRSVPGAPSHKVK